MGHIKAVFGFGWRYMRRYWGRLTAGILLGVLFGISNASFVWATKTIMERFRPAGEANSAWSAAPLPAAGATVLVEKADRVKARMAEWVDAWLPRVGRGLDWRQILGGMLFLPLLVSVRGTAEYLSGYCMGWVSERVINDMRVDLLEKLSSLSLEFFTRSRTGDLLTRINADTAALLRCLKSAAADLVREPISLLSVFLALCWIDWKLTMAVLVLVPLCMFPLLVLGKKTRRASRGGRQAEVLQASQLVELLGGIRILKAYNLEREQIVRFRELSQRLIRHGMKGIQAKSLVNPVIEVISMVGLSLLMIYIFTTKTTAGDFVGFLTGIMLFFLPIRKLAAVHVLFEQASVGVVRLAELLQEQPAVREPLHPKPLKSFRSEICFQNVSFAYADRPVIQQFNLRIPAGAKIGLAGPSGSGKSTVLNLLFRFYDPSDGAIRLDGVDLREVTFQDLRALMALVSQEIVLFDLTVAENIACGKPGATRAEIEAAARAAYAHEFIMQMPQGYESRIGERGVTLSGGQRQRLAIARAFVRNAPILVLDEATASLDSEAEAEVQKAIDHLSENRTVISVAHRLSTLAATDQVLVLAEGRIVEEGSFRALLDQGGLFAAMARRQGIGVNGATFSRPVTSGHPAEGSVG